MGRIAMTRVDYRLVHGQVGATWVKKLNANKVIILNDETAKDPFSVQVMGLALPGTKLQALTIDEGVKEFKKDAFGSGIKLIIFRDIDDAYKAYQQGFDFKSLNIGQVPLKEGRRRAVATICLSDDEFDILQKLSDAGVDVYNHQTAADNRYSFKDIASAMKK